MVRPSSRGETPQAGSGAEWAFDPAQPAALKAVARASGGVERLELTGIWNAPRPPQYGDVRQWILPALLLLFLIEALRTRLGVPLRWGMRFSRSAGPSVPAVVARRKGISTVSRAKVPENTPSQPAPPPEAPDVTRRERFRRAKRGE